MRNILHFRKVRDKRYLFIGGCARSGTGVLTMVVGVHNRIVIGNERYNRLCRKNQYSLTTEHFSKDRFYEMKEGDTFYMDFNKYHLGWEPKIFEKYDRCKYIGVKYTPIHQILPELHSNFPGLKILYIYRDIFDVAESWNRRAVEGKFWPPKMNYKQAVITWNQSLRMMKQATEENDNIICVNYNDAFFTDKSFEPVFERLNVKIDKNVVKRLKQARKNAIKIREAKGGLNEGERQFIAREADFETFDYFNENFNILK